MTLAVAICAGQLLGLQTARAQDSPAPIATIATSELHVQPGTDVPLQIKIRNIDKLPPHTIMLLRDLPPGIHLSEGRSFGNRLWVVPLNRVNRLKARIPAEAVGKAEIGVSLTTLEGTSIAQARLSLVVLQQATGSLRSPSGNDKDAAPTATPVLGTPDLFQPKKADRDLALKLLRNGNDHLETGNILVARQFYRRAAEYGSVEGARALAATYDPAILSQMKNVVGVSANADLAGKWYQIAKRLQSEEVGIETR